MSEVKRFRADHRHVVETKFDDAQFVGVVDFDRVTGERDAALDELGRYQSLFNQAQKAIDRLNELHRKRMAEIGRRLTAADERADVLESALRKIKVRLDAYAEADMRMPEPSVEVSQMIADAALKPTEGGGDD